MVPCVVPCVFEIWCCKMFTWVVEHGMVPLLNCSWAPQNVHLGWWAWNGTPPCSWSFYQLFFPCRHTCSSETHGTISTSLVVFVENVFTPLVSLLFLECKLHCGTCSHALKARAEAVLTTTYIVYMSFDVVLYPFLCVLLLCQPGLLSMEWNGMVD